MSEAATDEEIEWVVVRTFDDPVEADITLNFLRDHGIDVALRGNSGATTVLHRLNTSVDIRIVVPSDQLEDALDTLDAMNAEGRPPTVEETIAEGPYRAAPPDLGSQPATEKEDDFRPRMVAAGPFFAVVVPIGSGHFYARHGRTGTILAATIIGAYFFGLTSGMRWPLVGAALVVLLDAVCSVFAIRRYNDRAVPSDAVQSVWGLGIAAVGLLAGYLSYG